MKERESYAAATEFAQGWLHEVHQKVLNLVCFTKSNDNNVLSLTRTNSLAVTGHCQLDWLR